MTISKKLLFYSTSSANSLSSHKNLQGEMQSVGQEKIIHIYLAIPEATLIKERV